MSIFHDVFDIKPKVFNHFIHKIYYINLEYRTDRDKYINKQLSKQNLIAERFNAYRGTRGFEARLACNKSHAKIIETSKNLRYKNICIIEDDAMFDNNFIQLANSCIEELPDDWDMLFLGHCFSSCKTKIGKYLCIPNKVFCTHCYCINNKAFDTILDYINNSTAPIDHIYSRLCTNTTLHIYMCNPSIVSQIPNKSDIGEGPNNSIAFINND